MKTIIISSLPAIIFTGCVALVIYFYARLWLTLLYRVIRKRDTRNLLSSRFAICLHCIAGIGFMCTLYGHCIEPYRLQINTISIETEKLKIAHFRVVQISDTHCDKKARLEKILVDTIVSLKPDVIVFTGDTINHPSALPLFHSTMTKLKAPLGKFAVTGNWDFSRWSNLDLFGGTGFEELRSNEKIVHKEGESISLSGVAYEDGKHSFRVVGKLKPDIFKLFLYHNPDLIEYFGDIPIDLYLCGHTHGGQVALPFYGALTTLSRHGKRFEAGLYQQGKIQLYVNRGIGLDGGIAPRVRFFARPEITVFDIVPHSDKKE